ncbi:hypothetical protein BXZ70DRAFT_920461 [Cristinia sonorae]|uniref:Cytochrome c oxidase subunit 8, mitochondrial n=1 Tax=Cristinia sonorae TaxID=1940300 RepID=A0A8K0XT77_9AGAR|nr:hypothetical protein BXZ70DRAFT_920461 [Cristinia sonorae]
MSLIRASSSSMRLALNSGRVQSTPRLARFASDHAAGHNPVPFNMANKKSFKYKYLTFLATGFSIPFIAVSYQLKKFGGSTA